jgi:hypothetical protein
MRAFRRHINETLRISKLMISFDLEMALIGYANTYDAVVFIYYKQVKGRG